MGKVEIKIRKKILTPDNLQQYRDYPALLKKYERNKRFKRALRIFIYSLALTLFVLALIFLGMWKVLMDKNHESSKNPKTFVYLEFSDNGQDTVEYQSFTHFKTDSFYVVSYQYQYDNKFHYQYRLPISPIFNDTTFLFNDSTFTLKITYRIGKTIQIEGKKYIIIKYLISPGGIDADAFMFYSPDFGLLNIKSRTWGGYSRLIKTGNPKNDKIIQQLTGAIETDEAFFKSQNPRN